MDFNPSTDSIELSSGSDDDDYIHELASYTSEREFHSRLKQLQRISADKFKLKWESILDKYSKIDDEKESDEIDLSTGKIITDNGHLKSMGESLPSIWKDFDVVQLKDLRERNKKRFLRQSLIEQGRFTNSLPNLAYETSDNSYDTKSPSRDCDDNILLITPSPKKRKPESLSEARSPNKDNDRMNGSPRKHVERLNSLECQNKDQDQFNKMHGLKLTNYSLQSVNHELMNSKSYEYNKEKLAKASETYHEKPINYSQVKSESSFDESQQSSDFSDEFSIVSLQDSPESAQIYTCPFECLFGTGNKSLLAKHLIYQHRKELASVGYPVRCDGEPISVAANIKDKLNENFPLVWDIPELPFTVDLKPLNCALLTSKGPCQKWFLNKHELELHRKNPSNCSAKRQVLLCPLLGCGFMTDEGYLSWRNHFIQERHHIHPNDRNEEPIQQDINEIIPISTQDSGYASIDELFDDDYDNDP